MSHTFCTHASVYTPCTHISTYVWRVSTYPHTWCDSTSWEQSGMPDSSPGSIKLLWELGPIVGCWLRFFIENGYPQLLHRAFIPSKHFPSTIPLSLYAVPEGQLSWPPSLPLGSLRPSKVKRLAQGCIVSEESGPGARSPYSELKAFSPRFSCLSNETTAPSPSLPLRDLVRGQYALSIMGCKTH